MSLHVNPLVRLRFHDGPQLELLLEGRSFQIPDPAVIAALPLAKKVSTVDELVGLLVAESVVDDAAQADALVAELIRVGVCADGGQPPLWTVARHWIERGWTEALLFHLACQTETFRDENIDDIDTVNDQLLAERVAAGRPEAWHRCEGPVVELPAGRPAAELPDLETVLMARRSNQPWRKGTISLSDVATTAALASAETVAVRRTYEQQVTERPSVLLNSAFTALEIYLVAHSVEGLEPGLYHYEPDTHRLRLRRAGDLREPLQRMCVGQHRAGSGAATWVITAVWERYMWRYPQPSAYRTLMINTGELAQKLLVYSTALGLSTFITPAFDDDYADEVLGLAPAVETPVEVIGVG
jgi:SagB-type dehydrogenase family enzyme